MACAAAPTFFRAVHVPKYGTLVDGALIANNPVMYVRAGPSLLLLHSPFCTDRCKAIIEAGTLWPGEELELIVSVGTGAPRNPPAAGCAPFLTSLLGFFN